MDLNIRILIERLAEKGIQLNRIPGFIRRLTKIVAADPLMSRQEINRQMHLLGGYDFEIDAHTLNLFILVLIKSLADGEQDRPVRLESHLNPLDLSKFQHSNN